VLSGSVILPPYGRPVFGSISVGSSSTSFWIVMTARAVKRAFGCATPVRLLNSKLTFGVSAKQSAARLIQ